MTTERKQLARAARELANELESLTRGRSLFGGADISQLQQTVAEEYEAACERLRALDDLPGQRGLFAA